MNPMKSLVIRAPAALVMAVLAVLMAIGAAALAKSAAPLKSDKLIILSTQDAKGKTSPCG
jgi:hypothetical protein